MNPPSGENPTDSIRAELQGSFAPFDSLQRALRYWWLVVALMIGGGLLGWFYQRILPPVYEARVGFTVSFDLSNMGHMEQYEQDHASGAVGDLIFSTDVMQGVVEDATRQGLVTDITELASNSWHERQAQTWYVKIRSSDPEKASVLAQLWGERAYATLTAAYEQGVQAQILQRQLDALQTCLQRTALVEPLSAQCTAVNLAAIQNEMQTTGKALSDAKLASRGILPSLVIDWSEKAVLPVRPVLLQQGVLVLVGALLGLLLAVWAIELRLPERITGRNRRAAARG